jgi:hypothetical protein
MSGLEKCYIKLDSSIYPVRVRAGERETYVGQSGRWLSSWEFIDFLFESEKHDEIAELMSLGVNTLKEKQNN